MVEKLSELIAEVKALDKEIRELKKEMPVEEKYQPHYRIKISEATQKVREIRHHLDSLDLKNRRCDK